MQNFRAEYLTREIFHNSDGGLSEIFMGITTKPLERPLHLRSWKCGDRCSSVNFKGTTERLEIFTTTSYECFRHAASPLHGRSVPRAALIATRNLVFAFTTKASIVFNIIETAS